MSGVEALAGAGGVAERPSHASAPFISHSAPTLCALNHVHIISLKPPLSIEESVSLWAVSLDYFCGFY